MKVRLFLSLIFVTILGALTLSQIGSVSVLASTATINEPITAPITAPTYILGGRVGYRYLNIMYPVAGMIVEFLNTGTGEYYTSQTNSLGQYSHILKQGRYTVSVKDTEYIDFDPNQKTGNLNKDTTNINFKGIWK